MLKILIRALPGDSTSRINSSLLDDPISLTVGSSATVLILAYLSFSLLHPIFISGQQGLIMSGVAFVSSLIILTIAFLFTYIGRVDRANLALGLIALVVLVNCLVHIWVEQIPSNTINFVIYTVGVGFLIFSSAWFYSLQLAGIISWGSAVYSLNVVSTSDEFAWALYMSLIASVALHHRRRALVLAANELSMTIKSHADALKELVKADELAGTDKQAMFHRIVSSSAKVLGVSSVGIWSYDAVQKCIKCEEFHTDADRDNLRGAVISAEDGPGYFDALASSRVIDAHDAKNDPRTSDLIDYLNEHNISSMLDVPIIIRGNTWGVVCFEHSGTARRWSLHEQSFAASVADLAALAIQGHENAQLEKRSSQAERLESMGILAGGVAHDFNNLLTVILGHADIIEQTSDSTELKRNAQSILQASERAKELAQQMLAYSGRATFLAEHYDLSEMVKEFDAPWARELLQQVKLEFNLEETQLGIHADGTQIRQIITNLLTNARDANASRIEISTGISKPATLMHPLVSIENRSQDTQFAYVEVRDDGDGMDAEVKAKVFDPFYTTKALGSGLGLAATLGIVRAHDGTIEVESSPGTGSCFRVFIPLSETRISSEKPSKPNNDTIGIGSHERIIIVDDEELIVEITKEYLSKYFRNIESFSGYEEANDAFNDQNFSDVSVALIDLSLGDGDGVNLVHTIQSKNPNIPIVLMSGYDADESITRLNDRSTVQFLHKPFNSQQLISALNSAINVAREQEIAENSVQSHSI